MRKLTKTEIGVIAGRMANDIVAKQTKEYQEALKKIDAANKPKAKALIKEIKALPKRIQDIIFSSAYHKDRTLELKTVVAKLRPVGFNKNHKIDSVWTLTDQIKDELIVQQISCPDVTALQKIVGKKFGI